LLFRLEYQEYFNGCIQGTGEIYTGSALIKKSFMKQEIPQLVVPFTADLNQNLLVMKEIIGHNSESL
jgi:hypothetical protein